ncbi:MAG: hypothetical protein OXI73_12020 [Rhodospirillales bacterium]|nr:hypothetical protein [Rhodospirillales bacterium]
MAQREQALAIWNQLYTLFGRRQGPLRRFGPSATAPTMPADNRTDLHSDIPPVWQTAIALLRPLPAPVLELLQELTRARQAQLMAGLRRQTKSAMIAVPVLVVFLAFGSFVLFPSRSPLAFLGLHSPLALPFTGLALASAHYLRSIWNTWRSMQRVHNLDASLRIAALQRGPTGRNSS